MKLPLSKETAAAWLQWLLTALGGLVAGLCIYALSFGPVLKLVGAKMDGGGWNTLPTWVQTVYGPFASLPLGPLGRFREAYIQWWIS